ncbi:hypothetical protein P152DRAFT_456223 [Eremomyces bilateralis CBS 781.70]|uniref:Uncharacterized protein n=1 Tax=Eremomyces bilateralis CBS 781.70 TaxID=1392243 RepID=A0A6G1GAW4_9PEZI|nr:uncharacterized protein P152DRAFT_456223 [Eremomyces bilateralis CBS 781.70]KAF1815173.1 hypothetical protein P152DRAFT_456223 [Eremomyces bilateralis CBS 781.70]
MSSGNQQRSFFQSASFSSSSQTINGQTSSFKQSSYSDPAGTTIYRAQQQPGQTPVEERIEYPRTGRVAQADTRGRIEDVTETEKESSRETK